MGWCCMSRSSVHDPRAQPPANDLDCIPQGDSGSTASDRSDLAKDGSGGDITFSAASPPTERVALVARATTAVQEEVLAALEAAMHKYLSHPAVPLEWPGGALPLSRKALFRFAVARNWSQSKATTMLLEHLAWRAVHPPTTPPAAPSPAVLAELRKVQGG